MFVFLLSCTYTRASLDVSTHLDFFTVFDEYEFTISEYEFTISMCVFWGDRFRFAEQVNQSSISDHLWVP